MSEEGYDLQKSKKAVCELYPVIKDAFGHVIDGYHRLEASSDWKTETLPMIDTPVKLALARIVANTHRRSISKEERKLQLVTLAEELVKEGLVKEQAIPAIAELTTFSDDYLRHMLPAEYKPRAGIGGGSKPVVMITTQPHEHVYDAGSTKCKICGRELTAPESVKNGIGPVCAQGGASTGTAPAQQTAPTKEERGHAILDELYAKYGDPTQGFKRSILMMRVPCYSDEADRIIKNYKPKEAQPTPTVPVVEEKKPEPASTEKQEPVELVVEIRVDGVCIQGYTVKLKPGQKLEIQVDGDTVHTETAPEEPDYVATADDEEHQQRKDDEEETPILDDEPEEHAEEEEEVEEEFQPTGPEGDEP